MPATPPIEVIELMAKATDPGCWDFAGLQSLPPQFQAPMASAMEKSRAEACQKMFAALSALADAPASVRAAVAKWLLPENA